MAKLLVADGDKRSLNILSDWLEQRFTIDTARDGVECQTALIGSTYDVLILDSQLPKLPGIEICKWFRTRGGAAPIVMVSAQGGIEDMETSFAAGADDYLAKPFALRELSARLRALMRRYVAGCERIVHIGPLKIDPNAHTASVNGQQLSLTATEFAILEYFGRHPSQTISTHALLDRIWKTASGVSPDTVRVYIRRLRDKLEAVGHRDLIQNVHGIGYKLVATTRPVQQPPQVILHPVTQQSSPSQGFALQIY